MKHIFLDNIFEYEPKKDKGNLTNYKYDSKSGYWVNKLGQACISLSNFAKPRTKKADIETGEDQKGE